MKPTNTVLVLKIKTIIMFRYSMVPTVNKNDSKFIKKSKSTSSSFTHKHK